MDGLKISDVTMEQLNLDYKSPIRFRFQVEDDAENVGGLTLFGKGFGKTIIRIWKCRFLTVRL